VLTRGRASVWCHPLDKEVCRRRCSQRRSEFGAVAAWGDTTVTRLEHASCSVASHPRLPAVCRCVSYGLQLQLPMQPGYWGGV
jgi:hypothetical protein